jgi:hypothetical protein
MAKDFRSISDAFDDPVAHEVHETGWVDRPVIDDHGHKVGKVVDVVYDQQELAPRWAVVDIGVFGAKHYMPLEGAYCSSDGQVVAPFDRAVVKRAPKAQRDHVVGRALAEEIAHHYNPAA